MKRSALARVLAPALCVLAGTLQASDLRLDGRVSVTKLMRDPVVVSVSGGPNQPVVLFLDIGAGPVTLFGKTFPVSFSPSLAILQVGSTDASGNLTITVNTPSSPLINGAVIYMVAVLVDVTQPFPASLDVTNGVDLTVVDRNIDLAGNGLAQFPFFEHVTAFNAGSTVELGIDPTRYPRIVGRTADVYVVASKTKSEWVADPSLVDVVGGPQAVTFGGTTIQANTITIDMGTLAGPDESPMSADTRIGAPYDVVIDFDRDGSFGGIDLMDGYSASEAGLYVVRDLTVGGTQETPTAGAYEVTEIMYDLGEFWTPVAGSPATHLKHDTYYPTNIAQLGKLPLIVISHGNGHNYQWYDHLGYHLASYGYVVMSHTNNTGPGTLFASQTTIDNTDAILGLQSRIAGGVLNNHIDGDRIVWFGHSRGGDGITRAYDQLFDGTVTPVNYTIDDIRLVSSIAPVDDGKAASSNPHDVPYHLWVGQADADVTGCACSDRDQWYHLHDRATKARQMISLYGVGHAWFHNQNTYIWASGPCLLGKDNTHLIMKGYVVPLVRLYLDAEVPAKDFMWRQYESFRPIGAPVDPCVVVNLEYRESPDTGKRVIDDFQSGAGTALASSGAAVTATVPELIEGRLDDQDGQFPWVATDPWNGFVYGDAGDDTAGAIAAFDGMADYDVTYAMPAGQRRFDGFDFLSFRAAQTTRHPFTLAVLDDLTFSVTLKDGTGAMSSINIGTYGGGVEEPYQRNTNPFPSVGCVAADCTGNPAGWTSDFETIRIRLGDFLNNGNSLDLADIREVAFNFGPSWGSPEGRIGLDDLELTNR